MTGMHPNHQSHHSASVSGRIRQNTGSAALAAVLMLYFGFVKLSEPTGTELFDRCNWLLYHTLRLGGLAMAAIAVWSWFSRGPVLIVDAVVSVTIGVVLVLTGAGMQLDGGGMFQNLLLVVFGAMFISAGVRNGRDYSHIANAIAAQHHPDRASYDPGFEQRYEESRTDTSGASLASQLRDRAQKTADTSASRHPTSGEPQPFTGTDQETDFSIADLAATEESYPTENGQEETPDEETDMPPAPPLDGYLADLAKQDQSDEP